MVTLLLSSRIFGAICNCSGAFVDRAAIDTGDDDTDTAFLDSTTKEGDDNASFTILSVSFQSFDVFFDGTSIEPICLDDSSTETVWSKLESRPLNDCCGAFHDDTSIDAVVLGCSLINPDDDVDDVGWSQTKLAVTYLSSFRFLVDNDERGDINGVDP